MSKIPVKIIYDVDCEHLQILFASRKVLTDSIPKMNVSYTLHNESYSEIRKELDVLDQLIRDLAQLERSE